MQMAKIQATVTPHLRAIHASKLLALNQNELEFPPLNMPAKYQTHVGSLTGQIKRLPASYEDRHYLVRAFEHLSSYFHALLVNELLPSWYAYHYLEEKMSMVRNLAQPHNADTTLLRLYDSIKLNLEEYCKREASEIQGTPPLIRKDILKHLRNALRVQYADNPESRTLIFVATRAAAKNLCQYLNSVHDDLGFGKREVGFMTSTNQSATAGGQSSDEQREMVERFAQGLLKVLVVTSVAEEGIDISACNLIIKYNNVGSERTLIQRRGRARASGSKSILLALDGTVEQQELNNIQKEAMMMLCIQHLQSMSDNQLREMIKKKAAEIREQEVMEEGRKRELRIQLAGREFDLKCMSCSQLICSSRKVRMLGDSLYVCVEREIWRRTRIQAIRKPSKDGIITTCALLICKNCPFELGNVVKYSDSFLPTLTASKLQMERKDKTGGDMGDLPMNRRTWAMITAQYFIVDPIEAVDLRVMLDEIEKFEAEFKLLEDQETLANQLAMEYKNKVKSRKERVYIEE
ncbi:Type III restriction enzymeres subunit family protein [Aphelenchoides avenae]|nr:Type III restriction enzymeres subunit family protein [Aphelenchus avenae]